MGFFQMIFGEPILLQKVKTAFARTKLMKTTGHDYMLK